MFKQGDWLLTKRKGNIGIISQTRTVKDRRVYVVRFINQEGEWEERTAREGLEQRAIVVDQSVADILISMQLNNER